MRNQKPLTRREKQVCDLKSAGLLNKQVAFDLGVSEGTVKVTFARVCRKLGIRGQIELMQMNPNRMRSIESLIQIMTVTERRSLIQTLEISLQTPDPSWGSD